jgi:Trk K+ transport system NAD-binding subunit
MHTTRRTHKLLIVGLGRIGRLLLERLSQLFDITAIDKDPAVLDQARAVRASGTAYVAGDATSRLVLEEAGAGDMDAVIISTTREQLNLEVARLLHLHYPGKQVIAVGITPAGIRRLQEYGAEVQNIFDASVIDILNLIEHKSRIVHGIGIGRHEIRDVEVHPHSKLADKPICSLSSLKWRVGLIYRAGQIIVPSGETLLRARDRVIILGDPAALNTVAELLSFRFQNFPLEYGTGIAALCTGLEPDSFYDEVAYLRSACRMGQVAWLLDKRLPAARIERIRRAAAAVGDPYDVQLITPSDLPDVTAPRKAEYGLVVLSPQALQTVVSRLAPARAAQKFLQRLSLHACAPILLSRGTFPYERTVVACVDGVETTHVLEHALEMAPVLENSVTALVVKPSEFIASDEDMLRFDALQKHIRQMSSVHKTRVVIEILEGNPVKAVAQRLSAFNLLLLDTRGWKLRGFPASLLNPDVAWKVLTASPVSVMVLPEAEESF